MGPNHLDYYLDEFTFRFNRRRSASRGKLFFRLLEQAVRVEPVTYDQIHPRRVETQAIACVVAKWIALSRQFVQFVSKFALSATPELL